MKKNLLKILKGVILFTIILTPLVAFSNSPGTLPKNNIEIAITDIAQIKGFDLHLVLDDGNETIKKGHYNLSDIYDTTKTAGEGYVYFYISESNVDSVYIVAHQLNGSERISNQVKAEEYLTLQYNPHDNTLQSVPYINTKWDLWNQIVILFSLILPLIVTVISETILATIMLPELRMRTFVWTNIFTNLIMNFALVRIFALYETREWLVVLIAEIIVIFVEYGIYWLLFAKKIPVKRLFKYTVYANALSCGSYLAFVFLMSL